MTCGQRPGMFYVYQLFIVYPIIVTVGNDKPSCPFCLSTVMILIHFKRFNIDFKIFVFFIAVVLNSNGDVK